MQTKKLDEKIKDLEKQLKDCRKLRKKECCGICDYLSTVSGSGSWEYYCDHPAIDHQSMTGLIISKNQVNNKISRICPMKGKK